MSPNLSYFCFFRQKNVFSGRLPKGGLTPAEKKRIIFFWKKKEKYLECTLEDWSRFEDHQHLKIINCKTQLNSFKQQNRKLSNFQTQEKIAHFLLDFFPP